jgi:hypothetical protein
MPFDNPDEIERLKRELEEITAERDFLLGLIISTPIHPGKDFVI